MFVRRKRSLFSIFNRYMNNYSNIAFLNTGRMAGFTIGKVYKPFAYSFDGERYKNFCIFDDGGMAMYMENELVANEKFKVIYTNEHNIDYKINTIRASVDRENIEYQNEIKEIYNTIQEEK